MASISVETKIHAVEQCYAGAGSLDQIAERFGVYLCGDATQVLIRKLRIVQSESSCQMILFLA